MIVIAEETDGIVRTLPKGDFTLFLLDNGLDSPLDFVCLTPGGDVCVIGKPHVACMFSALRSAQRLTGRKDVSPTYVDRIPNIKNVLLEQINS